MLTLDLIALLAAVAAAWTFLTINRGLGINQPLQALFLLGVLFNRLRVACVSLVRAALQSVRGW